MGKHNKTSKKKSSNASLGKSLANNLKNKNTKKAFVSDLHRMEDRREVHKDLTSILEQDSLNEFTDLVNLSKKKFEVEKHVHLMEGQETVKNPNSAIFKSVIEEGAIRPIYAPLKLPRKPKWNKNMTKEELVSNENHAFLEWRRDVAMMEEGNVSLAITPFEKNIAVWKQLWGVVEKCQVLIQIVDARNPYFYYSADLEKYIKELDENKHYLLLLNKSDYLDETQIQHWSDYFKEKGVEHLFFSALNEKAKCTPKPEIPKVGVSNELLGEIKEAIEVDDEEVVEIEVIEKMVQEEKLTFLDDTHIYTREELLRVLRVFIRQRCAKPEGKDGRYTVGMVGYPNVGKSSVINVLLGAKKVGVASRPGKTKHYQSIYMGNDICLCDCPGLVFPSFAASKAEMVCCGVIPIDNLKDIKVPMNLVAKRIPKEMFEKVYKMKLPDNPTATEVMQIYAGYQGYVTGNGVPDENKSARIMLKDYNNGKLLFVHLRPDYNPEVHGYVNQGNIDFRLKVDVEESKEESKVDISFSGTETSLGAEYVPPPVPVKTTVLNNHKEEKFDKNFFEPKKERKLNKAQKRVLKFAVKRGEDPDNVDLEAPLYDSKIGALRGVNGYTEKKKVGINSNKVTHYRDLDVD